MPSVGYCIQVGLYFHLFALASGPIPSYTLQGRPAFRAVVGCFGGEWTSLMDAATRQKCTMEKNLFVPGPRDCVPVDNYFFPFSWTHFNALQSSAASRRKFPPLAQLHSTAEYVSTVTNKLFSENIENLKGKTYCHGHLTCQQLHKTAIDMLGGMATLLSIGNRYWHVSPPPFI